MYMRKSARPRMEPSGTPVLTTYSCEDFQSRTTRSHLLLRKEKMRPNIWPEIPWLKFVKRSIPNPAKSLGYIECYSWSSPRNVKSPSNSIRYHCQKICSWSRRPKTTLEIRKKSHSSLDDQQSCYLQVFQRHY